MFNSAERPRVLHFLLYIYCYRHSNVLILFWSKDCYYFVVVIIYLFVIVIIIIIIIITILLYLFVVRVLRGGSLKV